ncbi:MAG: VWA domain-containing protein [Bacteroidales bacterium]|nr:VWA domain-containing protein [Bacteroidales bacterium]
MKIFQFQNDIYLYGLFLIPVFVLFWVIIRRNYRKNLEKFADAGLLERLMPNVSIRKKNWKFAFLMFALISIIFTLANPQLGSKIEKVQREGIDMIIAVDISNSMLCEDIKPNRLSRAKRAISKLVDKLQGDRLGLIVFAGEAYTQLPITTDYSAAKMFLSTVNTDYISTQGTSISRAIELGRSTFKEMSEDVQVGKRNRVIVIITDGEDQEKGAIEQAEKAAKEGIIIYTIGMGTEKGGPIPLYRNGRMTGYKKDREGHTVITRLNQIELQKIASKGNGIFVRANSSKVGLNKVLDEINQLDKQEIESQSFKDYDSHFQIFAFLAILFLLLDLLLSERKGKLISKINLFD